MGGSFGPAPILQENPSYGASPGSAHTYLSRDLRGGVTLPSVTQVRGQVLRGHPRAWALRHFKAFVPLDFRQLFLLAREGPSG